MSDDQTKTIIVIYEVRGTSVGRMRNEITGRQVEPSVEPEFHGGEGTAPLPLAYFCTGLVACLMTQIRAFAKRMLIDLKGVDVTATIKWRAVSQGRDPYESAPVAFELDVDMESDASMEDRTRLREAAKKGCFIEATLANPIPVYHRLKDDGAFVAID